MCIRDRDTSVRCWGEGLAVSYMDPMSARAGTDQANAPPEDQRVPTPVPGLERVVQLALGSFHTCALLADTSVRCWGAGGAGELGGGARGALHADLPVAVRLLRGVAEIAAGGSHTCARTLAGTVLCWGANADGQLGDGTTTDRAVPTMVRGIPVVVQLAAGSSHTCARTAEGAVWCWGANTFGQLADGTTAPRALPVQVPELAGVVELAAGFGQQTCARSREGAVRCWGRDRWHSAPREVEGVRGAAQVATGPGRVCVLTERAEVLCWGNNIRGQLGDGTQVDRMAPTRVEF